MHHASADLEPKRAGETAMDMVPANCDIAKAELCDERRKGPGGTRAFIPTISRYIRARPVHKESSFQA